MSKKINIRPLRDRLVVQRLDEEEKTAGGIFIPDSAKEKPQNGIVVSVGDGKILDDGTKVAMAVKPNDKILFGKYSGTEIEFGGASYLIMREDDVLGIVAE